MEIQKPSINLQSRDLSLLSDLFHCRLLTLAQAAILHFSGSKEAAKKRIQKLKAVGLIGDRRRQSTEPSIHFLTFKGFKLLKEAGELADMRSLSSTAFEKRANVSAFTVKHELEVVDVKVAFQGAIGKQPNYTLEEFSTWPLLYEFEAFCPPTHKDVLVKPDGFIRIHEKDESGTFEHTFFLEVDRSTETLDTLVRKALCYVQFYRSGGMAVRNGKPASEFESFPFRALFVFATAKRRNYAAHALLNTNPPIFAQVWLGTLKEVLTDPFGRVWIRPIDIRALIPENNSFPKGYQGTANHDAQIEAKVRKLRIWED